jgi:hypothetical protein
MQNSVPAVGTEIPIVEGSLVLSRDQRTQVCRIKYQKDSEDWVMVPARLNRHGSLINHGLLVFLNSQATASNTHIRITAIQPTGKGAYASPATV